MTKVTSEAAHPAGVGSVGRYRWVIFALLFAAMVINYVDRQTIGVLKPDPRGGSAGSETDYADLVFYFQSAYARAMCLGQSHGQNRRHAGFRGRLRDLDNRPHAHAGVR